MEKIRVGIIGTGFTIGIALSHFSAYRRCPSTEVVAVYDCLPGRADAFLKKHEIADVAVANTLEELLGTVDAVSLCVPNVYHAELAAKVLAAGKHVLVEKPFSTNCETAKIAMDAAAAHPELVAMTGFNYREQAPICYMKEIIDSGILGKIRFVRHFGGGGRIGDSENVLLEWRLQEETSGTGSMADFGAHMLDLSDYLLRKDCGAFVSYSATTSTQITERYEIDPTDVMGGRLGDKKVPVTNDDTAVFTAITESGALFSFMTSRINLSGADFEIIGENGAISNSSKYPKNTIGMMLKGQPVPGQEKPTFWMVPVPIPEKYLVEGSDGVQHYGLVCEFADCILNHKKPVRDFSRGLFIQELIDKFAKAAKEGRTITD